ncbi:MAG: hypothetical protein QM530_02050 [Phycisphaerales bacterium]|nr:hypothetical protein [Phycisphaerales bacterium]
MCKGSAKQDVVKKLRQLNIGSLVLQPTPTSAKLNGTLHRLNGITATNQANGHQ